MSGHSKWSTIKRQKGAKDAARGAVFTKLSNAISVAAKSGGDPETNFALRLAIDKAKASNMPLANIQRSIDRGSGKLGGAIIHEVMYEGYGPKGVAILVEAATDNINRTLPDVRLAFSKHGGRIAEQGAVSFQFDRKGLIRIKGQGDDLMLQLMDIREIIKQCSKYYKGKRKPNCSGLHCPIYIFFHFQWFLIASIQK